MKFKYTYNLLAINQLYNITRSLSVNIKARNLSPWNWAKAINDWDEFTPL